MNAEEQRAWVSCDCWQVRSLAVELVNPVTAPARKLSGWMMHGCACKQNIFQSCDIYFQCYAFGWRSFHSPVWKRSQKGLRASNFALSWVVFKWHHGSDGVNPAASLPEKGLCAGVIVMAGRGSVAFVKHCALRSSSRHSFHRIRRRCFLRKP